MDAIETLKQDVQEGRISAERLVDLVVAVQQQLQATQQQLEAAKQLIEELKKQLGGAGTTKLDEPFSVRAEETRQEARGKKKPQEKAEGATRSFQKHRKHRATHYTRPRFSRGSRAGCLSPGAPSAGVAAGKRQSDADRLPNLSRPEQSVWQNPRRALP